MTAIGLAEDVLRAAFGGAWHIRTQGPIALDNESETEPDVAVVSGSRRHYSASHPTQPVLLVEVADASLGGLAPIARLGRVSTSMTLRTPR
jgi:Uma2 family endonuclease